jgi:hypothetical protein
VSPADAEGVPGRVGIHLMALVAVQIGSWLQQSGAEGDCLLVCSSRVMDVEVEMRLLGVAVRPVRRNMVRSSCTPIRQ